MSLSNSYKNVTADDVNGMMNNSDVQIIDVRESFEYAMGHIQKAELVPLSSIPSRLDEISKDKKIVVVCASGGRSVSASEFLNKHGYDVYNMLGGMMSWRFEVAR